MARVTVIGLGAIGATAAAHIVATGRHEVIGCTRTPLCTFCIDSPRGTLRARIHVAASDERAPPSDFVLLATKAHQTASAAPRLVQAVAPAAIVAVLQNGVEHEARVRPFAPDARVLPVVVECPSTRLGPGHVVLRGDARFVVPAGADGDAFGALFEGTAVTVESTQDFPTALWTKLCRNVAGGAITALTGEGLGVIRRPEVERLARDLVRECIAVGAAEGASLGPELVDAIIDEMRAAPHDAPTSMLTDLRQGRPLEYDARNGAVVRLGRRHGISTPRSADVARRLAALSPRTENGVVEPDEEPPHPSRDRSCG